MTILEKAKELGVEIQRYAGGEWGLGCPSDHKLDTVENEREFCVNHSCVKCYAREYTEPGQTAEDKAPEFDYWANISAINARQTAKGLSKYGQPLEENVTLTRTQRIEHAQEEAIDLLKYLEHLKLAFTDELSANDYHRAAMRTSGTYENQLAMIRNAAYGMNGEAGEVIDLLKKHEFQGHPLDTDKLLKETGDVLWYCALMAEALGTTLQEIMERNIEKLKERYPDGFDKSRSINRKE
jgi:NTP pyrophosphatase (non-canonical NTP hydrolase)